MIKKSFNPVVALAAVAVAATMIPAAASAQSYGYGNGYGHNDGYRNNGYSQSYDRCSTLGQGRTGAGALIGGGIGAVAGSQIAGRGNRTEGSIIGGVLGAVIGAQVGRASNDNCRPNDNNGYAYDRYNDRAQSRAYDDRNYGRYDRRDDRRRHDSYDNRRDSRRYDNGYEVSADGHYYYDPRRGWLPR